MQVEWGTGILILPIAALILLGCGELNQTRSCFQLILGPGGVRHDPQRVLGKNIEMAHLPLVTIE